MSTPYRLVRTDNTRLVESLDGLIFPDDEPPEWDAAWLVVPTTPPEDPEPVGFCTARKIPGEPGAFLSRAGLLQCARGQGLQRRMIRVRERWARAEDLEYILTYTRPDNYPSIMSLIRCGYRLYTPARYWGGSSSLYFVKALT